MFTRVSVVEANPGKSIVALENEFNAGLHVLDGESQNLVEVLTGVRLQQHARPGEELPGEGEGGGEVAAVPVLASLNPNTAVVGSTDFKLRVLGSDFKPGCTIVWNGGDELTEFVSETELTTGVKPSTASGAATIPVSVRNPDAATLPDGTVEMSNELPFTFTEPTEADLKARADEQKKAREAKTREREKAEKDHERQEKEAAKHPEGHPNQTPRPANRS